MRDPGSLPFAHWWWMLPVLLLFTILVTREMNMVTFSDEIRTMHYAGLAHEGTISFTQSLDRIAGNVYQAPFYYLLMWAWGWISGDELFINRLPSLLIGVLTLAMVYRLGKELHSSLLGVSAAFILAASAYFTGIGREMRAFTLVTLLATISLWGYFRMLKGETSLLEKIAFFAGMALLPYTHYSTIILPLGVGLYHLFFVKKSRRWLTTSVLLVFGQLMFFPWLRIAYRGAQRLQATNRADPADSVLDPLQTILSLLGSGEVALIALLLVAGLLLVGRVRRLVPGLFALAVVGVLLVNIATGAPTIGRYMVAVLPLGALFAGMGVVALTERRLSPLIIFAVILFFGWQDMSHPDAAYRLRLRSMFMPWHEITPVLSEEAHRHDLLLLKAYPDRQGRFLTQAYEYYVYMEDLHLQHYAVRTSNNPETFNEEILNLRSWLQRSGYRRVIVVDDPGYPDTPVVDGLVASALVEYNYRLCRTMVESGTLIMQPYVHQRANETCDT